MDRWLIPATVLLIVLAVAFPVLFIVYGALVALVGLSAAYNAAWLPGPYLSLLEGCDGLRLNWLCSSKGKNGGNTSCVAITKDGAVVKVIMPDRVEKNLPGGNFTIQSAPITGLVAGERYKYRVEIAGGRGRSKVAWGGRGSWFFFPGKERRPHDGKTRIAALGDMQPKSIMPPVLQATIMHKVRRSKPDLFIYLGDHTNTGNDTRAWFWYIRLIGIVARNTPVIGTPGNHDAMKKNASSAISGNDVYSKFVNYPGNRRYYHVKIGGIHLVSLDYQDSIAPGTPQHRFMANVLQEHTITPDEWLLVFSHSTPYNTAIKPTNVPPTIAEMRAHVKPLIEKHRVMWLGGHEHAYQKFTVDGVHYITTAATSSFHDHDNSREFMDVNVKRFHFVLIDVIAEEMHVRAIPLTGKAIDDFSIQSNIPIGAKAQVLA